MKQERSRMRFRIRTILKLGLVFVIGIRVGTVGLAALGTHMLAVNNDQVVESVELLTRLMDISSNLRDAESAQRAYLHSGHEDFLVRFNITTAQTIVALGRLGELTTRPLISPAKFKQLANYINEEIEELKRIVTAREQQGADAAVAIARNGRGRTLANMITPLVNELERTERDHLTRRTGESAAVLKQAFSALLGTTVLVLLLVVGVYSFLTQLIDDQERDEEALKEQAQQWQATLTEEHHHSLSREQENTRRLQELARLSTRLYLAHDFDTILNIVVTEARRLLGVRRVEATTGPSDTAHAPTAGKIELPIPGRNGQILAYLRVTLIQKGNFDERDRAILDQLVHIASVAIENARLYQELRENDHSKDRFLAMLAHELRNPLAAISSAVTLGRNDDPRESSLWSIDVIERQAHRLTRLIDDLLDVSRITQGKITLRLESVDLALIAASAIDAVRPFIEQRYHTLVSIVPEATFWVDGDSTRLEQIFTNLLTNAAKYTKSSGQIRVTIARDGNEIVTRVADSGIGISSELLPRIFDLFTQGDRSLARAEGGLGIGLTLVKTLTELHGGSVSVVSDGLDAGSEFIVRLPAIAKVFHDPGNGPADDRPSGAHRPVRILVVDDNVDLANGLVRLMKKLGHTVKAINDGRAAIELARVFRPEAVLLDIGLPGMDGYEVASRLRSQHGTDPLILVAISGYGQEEDQRRSLEAGFDFHLVKPIDMDALRHIINRISRSSLPEASPPSTGPSLAVFPSVR
jgi:signal transduction histidine kinase/CHASE3 domain sensor protein/ActR/RegA family two-component response regulator